ncbi:heparanase-like isoform X2 [Ptychodera flava]|uniref:heparanase-like isoform X2 n=1 Tax=Ptychodera flava TaxID=63121 RepID=UPI003969D02B
MTTSFEKLLFLHCLIGVYFTAVGACTPSVKVNLLGYRNSKPGLKYAAGGQKLDGYKLQGLSKSTAYTHLGVNTDTVLRNVSDKFLSFAIDAFMIRNHWHYHDLNFSAPRLLTLAEALQPGYLRVSGTAADFMIFNDTATSLPVAEDNFHSDLNFTMTAQDWDIINTFAVKVGWQLIFGLNVLLRDGQGQWNPDNALKLFKYTIQQGYRVHWELGNEPNLFPSKANMTVSPSALAKDFRTLRNILNSKEELRDSLLFGPDTTKPLEDGENNPAFDFLKGFVSSCNVTNATTFHQYYLCSHPPTPESFINPDNLEILPKQIQAARDVVNRYRPGSALWLGETGTTCSAGSSSLSKTYVAGFMWLDKLGLAATNGLNIVIRQTFCCDHQAMVESDATPLPDYWLSVLYKRLVGHRVLSTKIATKIGFEKFDAGVRVRAYAHCTRTTGTNYTAGSVTVFMMSLLSNETVTVYLTGALSHSSVDKYVLSAHEGEGITSRRVDLNGQVLQLVDNSTLPELSPQRMGPSDIIQLPPLSMGFFVLTDVKAAACL